MSEIINELVQQGQVSREDGERLLDEVIRRAQEQGSEIRSFMNQGIDRVLERTGLARQKDVQELIRRIEELEAKLGMQAQRDGDDRRQEGDKATEDADSSDEKLN